MYDICMKGFVDGYYNWTAHGEAQVLENYDDQPAPVCSETPVAPDMRTQWGYYEQMNWDQRMVYDTVRPQFFSTHPEPEAEGASSSFPADVSSYDYDVSGLSERFFDVVHAADQPLYNGCDESQLAAVARLVNIKAEHNMSERCYDQVSQWASDLLPRDHTLPSNYYNTKKMIRDLGLPVEKIHACKNGCMLYWKDDIDMEYCKFCGDPRYKATRDRNPRKKSPYAVLRNVYELRDMFLTMVISGPSNPKRLIDVYLEPLIDELLQLWHVGVRTHDHTTNRAFMMRAALMWTVNDLPAYGMASGWSTAGYGLPYLYG
ncbi:UNVERIFIED_CONTAM: hypothetical protein Sradi_7055500 [Sesamum radiatum]|uniref:Uncharacterized protein n=1 Tax=Sesamum radiatum TaxID=300843 RepID=A0AAW2J8R3_SESRA